MSSARDEIFGRIKAATGSLPSPCPHPGYERTLPHSRRAPGSDSDLAAYFGKQLNGTGACWAEDWKALTDLLRAEATNFGYCAPEFVERLHDTWPEVTLETTFDRAQVDAYSFGITPAWGAIAETGTLILTDTTTPSRLAALAPWIHVAVVPRERIFATVTDAIEALPSDPSIVLVTGPSKTADIEGILIEGVHGPGRQIAVLA